MDHFSKIQCRQKGVLHILLLFVIVTLATIGIYFAQKNNSIDRKVSISAGSDSVSAPNDYLVKPYLFYPSDKPTYPEYETAVKSYMVELQAWYGKQVGKTFNMSPLQVIKSSQDYLTIRCGEKPTQDCLNNPAKLDGNLGQFVNKAIHNGVEKWDDRTVALVFAAGAGGYAGGDKISNDAGWAIVGDWVLEPISGKVNDWGIPCKYSDGWQCKGNTPKGTPAHEIGHAFGLEHPVAGSKSIMIDHSLYPDTGFLPSEIEQLKLSPFFAKTETTIQPMKLPVPVSGCPTGTVKEECIGYSANNINAYCYGANNSYLGGKCSGNCPQADKCGLTNPVANNKGQGCADSNGNGANGLKCTNYVGQDSSKCPNNVYPYVYSSCSGGAAAATPIPTNSQDCDSGLRKECIGYASNKINAYCWQGSTYIKSICNKDCSNWEQCR